VFTEESNARQELSSVSIVVACRNEAAGIGALLRSASTQLLDGWEWEVILADGMSEDGTREIVREFCALHPRFRMVDNQGLMVSTGLNKAIRMARGEYIVRMDAHTEYDPTYCRTCLKELLEHRADNAGGPARTIARTRLGRAVAAAYQSPFSSGGARFHDVGFEGWTDTVPYGCWRRSTLERLGLFDESLVRNQDDELNLRIVRAGGRIWQSPRIVSWYHLRESLRGLCKQYFQYGFWKVAVIRKHRIPASWRHLVAPAFVAATLCASAVAAVATWLGDRDLLMLAAAVLMLQWFAYVTALAVAAVITASRSGWEHLPVLPVVFAAYHLAWGLGFLLGCWWLLGRPSRLDYRTSKFTEVNH
jgi:succinoglycan biosynthesis protein ExoA